MTTGTSEVLSFGSLVNPAFNDCLKAHSSDTFKLIKTVSDFNQQLSQIYEQQGEQLQLLVASFRRKNNELYKERAQCSSGLFELWESCLQEVEFDSNNSMEIAKTLSRQVSRQLLERSFYRKIQSRKVFAHRESLETILTKTEDKLAKFRQDYKDSFMDYLTNSDSESLILYMNSHNAYVQQLQATNGMLEEYNKATIPKLLQELEDIYADICLMLSETVNQSAEIFSNRNQKIPIIFKEELMIDETSLVQVKPSYETLKSEADELENQIKQIQDSLENLIRVQQKSLESNLYNKVNELQENISVKSFDLYVAQLHLSAIISQKQLFSSKLENHSESTLGTSSSLLSIRDRKVSNTSIKSKWVKAFKNLKTTKDPDNKKNPNSFAKDVRFDSDPHNFQEYTYKKITPCDICSQILRGHTKQGARCRSCKINVHYDCQSLVNSRCQSKSKLLRRQKSTSETDNHYPEIGVVDEDPGCGSGTSSAGSSEIKSSSSATSIYQDSCSISAQHTSRKPKLNLRMKSFSLDSPESTDLVRRRKYGPFANNSESQSSHSSSSKLNSPSNTLFTKKQFTNKNLKMSSIEQLTDDDDHLSPNLSPTAIKNSHRLMDTNYYVVLYNFKSRNVDELDLKAGCKVTILDSSDPDWWKGKCFGKIGYFPSKYCTRLVGDEKPLQVTHNLQVSDGENDLMLLRDQIVIQIGKEIDGMILIRSADSSKGLCPAKYLQDI